jgi:hypothetical protein
MKRLIIFILAHSLISVNGFSQEKKKVVQAPSQIKVETPASIEVAAESLIPYEDVVSSFYKNVNAYFNSNSPNLDQVSRFLSDDFIFVRNTSDIVGKVRTVRWTSEELFRDFKATKDYNVKSDGKVSKILFNQSAGNLANISALITIRYYQDTTTVAEVDAFVSHSLVKENGQWKIKGIVMDRVATNQKIGVCPCKISRQSSENNNQYNAKVMYPNGNSFETDEYTISIKKESNFSIVTFGSNYYTWKDNIVYATKVEGNPTSEMLGKALTNNEVIVLILAKSLYVGQCRKFESLK